MGMGLHDHMTPQEFDTVCEIACNIVKPGGTIIIFAGLDQISKCNEKFKEQKLMVNLMVLL